MADYGDLIRKYAEKYGVSPLVMHGIIQRESSGNPNATNPKSSSTGLMQMTRGTAHDMGWTGSQEDLKDPNVAIDLGAKYLRKQMDRYGGNEQDAISAYNLGTSGRTPTGFTNQGYVNSVLQNMPHGALMGMGQFGGGPVPPEQAPQKMGFQEAPIDMTGFNALQMDTAGPTADVNSAESAYNVAQGASINPQLQPVHPLRSGMGILGPNLLANLATAISGNPLYAGQFSQGMHDEEEQRYQAEQQNAVIQREISLQQRHEGLTELHDKLARARDILEKRNEHNQALKLHEAELKIKAQIDKNNDDRQSFYTEQREMHVQEKRNEGDLAVAMARFGIQRGANGAWERVGGSTTIMTHKERLESMDAVQKLLADPKLPGPTRKQLEGELTSRRADPDDATPNFGALRNRIMSLYPDPNDPTKITPMAYKVLMGKALQWKGILPDAQEYYDEVTKQPPPASGAEKPAAGSTTAASTNSTEDTQKVLFTRGSIPAGLVSGVHERKGGEHTSMARVLLRSFANWDAAYASFDAEAAGYNPVMLKAEFERVRREQAASGTTGTTASKANVKAQ